MKLTFLAIIFLSSSCVMRKTVIEELKVAKERRKTWVDGCFQKANANGQLDGESLRKYQFTLISIKLSLCGGNDGGKIPEGTEDHYINLKCDIDLTNAPYLMGSEQSLFETIKLDAINLQNRPCPSLEQYVAESRQRAEQIQKAKEKEDMEKRKQIEAERLASLERAERLILMKKEMGRLKAAGATHNIFISVVEKPFCNEQLDGDWICAGAIACPIDFEIYNFQELIEAYSKCETGASVKTFVFKPSQGKGLKLSFPNGDGRPWLAAGTLAGIPVRRGKNVALVNMFGRKTQAARWIEVSVKNMAH